MTKTKTYHFSRERSGVILVVSAMVLLSVAIFLVGCTKPSKPIQPASVSSTIAVLTISLRDCVRRF